MINNKDVLLSKGITSQTGQAFLLVTISVTVVMVTVLLLISSAQLYYQNANYSNEAEKASDLAEAGVDKAVASFNKLGDSYNGESGTVLGEGSFSVAVANKDITTKILTVTGFVPNETKPVAKRTIKAQISTGTGISFVYGMLTGNGGISMGNNSVINGSVYSNGSILGGNNGIITGDAYVAGGTEPTADQQTDCTGVNCSDFVFGKMVNGNSQLDVAQSFKPATTAVLNQVSLKLKKIGSPANLTVRIMADNGGSPNQNSILASGTLAANLVGTQYGFVNITFDSSPSLTAGTTYWIMVAAQTLDSSNYWLWQNDLAASYNSGVPEWSPNWSAKNPVWNPISGDLSFQTYMGGVATSISMGNGSVVQGNVHAHTINGLTINKDAYYQTITNSTVKGNSYPGSTDPPPIAMPISASNIADWQNEAIQQGVSNGDINGCPSAIGPGKIVGNFTTGSNCTIAVKTPIWITGNLTVNNSVILKLDSSFGASSGLIIVDGLTSFSNSDDLQGTGNSGSYLALLSTYNSQTGDNAAIDTGNSSITGILYAPLGTVSLANSARFKEVIGWQIKMGNGTTLTYDSGLINTFFSSGPGGSYSVVKGTYQIK